MKDNEHIQVDTAVFDICDTLYYSNTTHDFIHFVHKTERFSFKTLLFRILNSRILPFRYALILISVKTHKDLLKNFNVATLKGRSREQLKQLAKKFVKEYLSTKEIEQTQELLRKHIGSGMRVVLCSSSIDPVVTAVAEELGIENYIGTELEFHDDCFTGHISEDITRSKLEALKRRDLLGNLAFAASDNVSDMELLSQAELALAIVHRGRKLELWRDHNFDIINLD